MSIPKLQRISLKSQVYEYLKKAIINGELQLNQMYSEQYFADKLSISRTPVREAVLQLQHENMLEIKTNRGFTIKPLYLDEIKKIIETRLAIEGYSCSTFAKKINEQEGITLIKKIENNLIRQRKSLTLPNSHYEFMLLDLEFHQSIIDFTKNNYFAEIINMLRTRLEIATLKSLHEENRLEKALAEHIKIYEAIKSGNARKAFESYEFHMLCTLEVMEKCYDT